MMKGWEFGTHSRLPNQLTNERMLKKGTGRVPSLCKHCTVNVGTKEGEMQAYIILKPKIKSEYTKRRAASVMVPNPDGLSQKALLQKKRSSCGWA